MQFWDLVRKFVSTTILNGSLGGLTLGVDRISSRALVAGRSETLGYCKAKDSSSYKRSSNLSSVVSSQ